MTVNSSRVAKIGHRFKIQCQSNGIPLPKFVSWFNNSSPLHPTSTTTTEYDKTTGIAILTISEITRYNLSTIECRFKQELQAGQYHHVSAITTILPTGNSRFCSIECGFNFDWYCIRKTRPSNTPHNVSAHLFQVDIPFVLGCSRFYRSLTDACVPYHLLGRERLQGGALNVL